MLGAIIGDMVGSRFEFNNTNSIDFELFTDDSTYTDDSICTIAVADALLRNIPFANSLQYWCRKYPSPQGGYGSSFVRWIFHENPQPYNSWGNGSAMRVSPVGWAFDTTEDTLREAQRSAMCTHNHPEGIKGAMVAALAIYLVRKGISKEELKHHIETHFGYNLSRKTADIRPVYQFDESCQGTVPEAIICYLESSSFVDAIRLAVSLGGDSDTLACITGGIAEADSTYFIPGELLDSCAGRLPQEMRNIIEQFYDNYKMHRYGRLQ